MSNRDHLPLQKVSELLAEIGDTGTAKIRERLSGDEVWTQREENCGWRFHGTIDPRDRVAGRAMVAGFGVAQ